MENYVKLSLYPFPMLTWISVRARAVSNSKVETLLIVEWKATVTEKQIILIKSAF